MSRIHFVGSISPFEEACNPSVSIAGNRCQIGILDGLKSGNEIVQVISYRPNQVFPFGKKVYVSSLTMVLNGLNYFFVPYLNLPFVRGICVNLSTIFHLIKKIRKNDSILFYNIYMPFPISVFILRKFFDIQIYVLACDVHIPGQTVPNSLRWRYEYLKHKFVLHKADGVVAVTEKILLDFNCEKKTMVMEGGIQKDLLEFDRVNLKGGELFKLLYAGALNKLNGVDLLVEAFSKNVNPNIRLIIAGSGELREAVESAVKKDNRIEFLGVIGHDKIISLYEDISLLLCIRITKDINTGYFFPSKLIEYLSTGIPTVCTNLTPLNFNLNNFCYVLKDESVDAIGLAINECITQYPYLVAKAKLGKDYVRQEMLWDIQGKKISAFIADR